MARDPAITAINCTSCGAGLDLLGGGRVTVHVCPYCGTVLDANAGYRAVRRFTDMPRPDSPLRIGMTGQLRGVDYTIIGTLGLREQHGGKTWTWVDHQLYSPTHGYAWITFETGHFTLTRRVRNLVWLSSATVERAENRPSVWVGHERYSYYETSESEITFAEGEFTWAPEIGARALTVSALSDAAMISFTESASEREVDRSTYLPRETVAQAFGLDDLPPSRGTHPLTPMRRGPNFDFLRIAPLALALVCLVLGAIMAMLPGTRVIPDASLRAAALPVEIDFDIPDTGKLTRIQITGDVNNSWAWLDLEVTGPDDLPVFATERGLEYYHGVEDGESWSEGSRTSRIFFRPGQPGVHTLSLELGETGRWGSLTSGQAVDTLSVSIRSGESSGFWLFVLAAAFAAIAALPWAQSYLQTRRRWAGSDWTDDS